jgi:hypothetical protein
MRGGSLRRRGEHDKEGNTFTRRAPRAAENAADDDAVARPPRPVFFVALFPTLPNIQGLARFDEGRNRNDKRKATVTTNDRGSTGSWASLRGSTTSISSSRNPATRYEPMIPAVGSNDDDAPDGDAWWRSN